MRIEKSKRQSAEVEESGLDTYENRNRAMEDLAVPLDVHAMISSGQLAFEPYWRIKLTSCLYRCKPRRSYRYKL